MVVNVDQLQAEVDALQGQVKQLSDQLALLTINGLNDAFDGSGNQMFGGDVMWLNRRGIQIKAPSTPAVGSAGFKALFWLEDFAQEPGFASNRSYADGHANTTESVASLSAVNSSSATDGTGGYTAGVFASALATGEMYVLVRPELLLDPQTVDPTVLGDGALWYRTDTDKFRARANGATENLATESYVTANAGGTVKTEQMITPWSWCSLGVQLASQAAAAPGSATWPTSNKAIYVPFTLDESTTFTKAFWYNGSAVSGNVDIGIYNEAGTRQVSIGSTAQAGTSVIQEVNIADTTLAAGRYYMALAMDNTTGTMVRTQLTVAGDVQLMKGYGMAEQTTAFVLPATATLATIASAYLPFFGFSIRTLVV